MKNNIVLAAAIITLMIVFILLCNKCTDDTKPLTQCELIEEQIFSCYNDCLVKDAGPTCYNDCTLSYCGLLRYESCSGWSECNTLNR